MSLSIKKLIALLVVIIIAYISVSQYFSQGITVNEKRFSMTNQNDIFDDNTNKIVYLAQNWSPRDSLWFYNTTQGSNWMPYRIFLHLEQTNSHELFRSNQQMNRYRYLLQQPSKTNPDGLPLGFVKNTYQEKDFVGFTCAACHTSQLDYKGIGIRIDGGAALADMDAMLLDAEQALKESLNNEAKFTRLAKNVLGHTNKDATETFRKTLTTLYNEKKTYNQRNNPLYKTTRIDYGFARLDAFGRIYNRALAKLTPDNPNNFNPPIAPVSYPFLWDTPYSDFVQWNGIGNNHGKGLEGLLGSLGRNTGQVLGVFASFDVTKKEDGGLYYESSVHRSNLLSLERHLQSLQSPQWPENILPPIDKQLAKQGKTVYKEYRCGWCHGGDKQLLSDTPAFEHNDSDRLMIAQFATLPWIQTDPQMAINALQATGKSGIYQGQPIPKTVNKTFSETESLPLMLGSLIRGSIFSSKEDKLHWEKEYEIFSVLLTSAFYLEVPETQRHNDFEILPKFKANMFLAYKARTLNGIWATAPYLHNGSVPNLYELFLPYCSDIEAKTESKQCRSNHFTVGSRSFDPIKVGFVNKNKTDYPELFEFDSNKLGNSNKGHEYAAGITPIIKLDPAGKPIRNTKGEFESFTLPPMNDNQRKALVEYLKTL